MKHVKHLLALLLLFSSFQVYSNEDNTNSKPLKIKEAIEHHLLDDYYFTLFKDEKEGKVYGFPLPIILWDNGLKLFSSAAFIQGDKIAKQGDQYYILDHTKIYRANATGDKIRVDGKAVKPWDFSITKSVVGLGFIAFLLFVVFIRLAQQYKKDHNQVPKGLGRFIEPLLLYVRDEIAKPNIGDQYKPFMPFLLSVFFLIWLLNLLGLTPFGFNITGNISVTFCLALLTLVLVNVKGNKSYWQHILWMPNVPYPVRLILMPIEVLGIFTKGLSLMIRLYANNMAGHTVIMGLVAIIFLFNETFTVGGSIGISLILTLFIYVIKILAAFLQAYIFTILTALFIGQAVNTHEE